MSGVQMFLVIGGITLFSVMILNINHSVALAEEQRIDSELLSTATSVGQSLLNEITSKAFDNAIILNPAIILNQLTLPLGPELGEVYSTFNDVDDYHGYIDTVSTPRGGDFKFKVNVNYVNNNNVDLILPTRTRTKRIEVLVQNDFMQDTLKLYYYKSY